MDHPMAQSVRAMSDEYRYNAPGYAKPISPINTYGKPGSDMAYSPRYSDMYQPQPMAVHNGLWAVDIPAAGNFGAADPGWRTDVSEIQGYWPNRGEIVSWSKDGFPIRAAAVTDNSGEVLGYSKDGFPVRAAATGGVLGGYHFREAGITDQIACGGSQAVFVAVGLALGWLLADAFVAYAKKKV